MLKNFIILTILALFLMSCEAFKPKKVEEPKAQVESKADIDLEIIMKMNQEFASSLDLDDTLVYSRR